MTTERDWPTYGLLRKKFHALCERAGMPRIKLHQLRHTAGSLWLEAGVPLVRQPQARAQHHSDH